MDKILSLSKKEQEGFFIEATSPMQLMPNEIFIGKLRQDCAHMAEMFFGNAPDFDEVMGKMADIEKVINS